MRTYNSQEVIPARILLDTETAASEPAAKRLPHLRLVIQHSDHWFWNWQATPSIKAYGGSAQLDLS